MKTGRADLDVMVKVASIPADEPTFLLRAQDPDGAGGVRDWTARAMERGVPPSTLEQALRQADAMDRWPVKKAPSDDHLSDDEAKNLAYAFSRRAWQARDDRLDLRVALAQQRGWNEAMGVLDALLTALKAAAVCVDRDIALHAPGGLAEVAAEDPSTIAAEYAALIHMRDAIIEPAIARAEAVRA